MNKIEIIKRDIKQCSKTYNKENRDKTFHHAWCDGIVYGLDIALAAIKRAENKEEQQIPQVVKDDLKKLAEKNGLEYIESQIVTYSKREIEDYFVDERYEIVTEYNGKYYTMDNY